jgi:hypothetical protein
MTNDDLRSLMVDGYASSKQLEETTPAARWREEGKSDPHGNRYDCDRASLPFGHLTDDELANQLFICDHRRSLDSLALLTAAKDRIRWLSRALMSQGGERSETEIRGNIK